MTQIATVEKLLPGGYAEISVPRKSACGHDCEECAGCGMTGAAIKARAKNDPNAQPGEKVVVESSTRKLLGVVALVYVLPVVCFLRGISCRRDWQRAGATVSPSPPLRWRLCPAWSMTATPGARSC